MRPDYNVLLVDDDEHDLFLIELGLRSAGARGKILPFPSAVTAIAYLKGEAQYADREKYPLPHIILTDIHYPFITDQILSIAQQRPKLGIPITVFSGSSDADDIRKSYLMGASSYIQKDIDAYKTKLKVFYDYWTTCERSGNRQGLMFVDDCEDDRYFSDRAFRGLGVTSKITHMHSAASATDYLLGRGEYEDREQYPLPCHVLTDLKMGADNGLELLKAMNRRSEMGLPVVVISGSDNPECVNKAYEQGASSYLYKSNLEQKMRTFHSYWSMCELPYTDSRGIHKPTSSYGKIGEKF